MNEFELKQSYRLLCDRISNVLRNDRQFAGKWGGLFTNFEGIDTSVEDGYSGLDAYEKILAAVAENAGGRFDKVQNAMARARSLEEAAHDVLSGMQLTNRVAEIRLRLLCQTLNACFPADGDGTYRWAPAFDVLELPSRAEPGRTYDGSVRRADGKWICPVEGTTDPNVFGQIGLFTFNSQDKATFAARHYAALFRDWLDSDLGYKRIEL